MLLCTLFIIALLDSINRYWFRFIYLSNYVILNKYRCYRLHRLQVGVCRWIVCPLLRFSVRPVNPGVYGCD